VLNLPFPAAAKTGTSGTPRGDAAALVYDNWTLGYTPDLVTGVWIGNADYSPMVNTSGSTGAAPIWSQFMQYAAPIVSGGNLRGFESPPGIVEKVICALSGTEPSQWCRAGEKREVFASDQPPLPASMDLFRKVKIDTWSGLEASPACGDEFAEEVMAIRVDDPWARKWLESGPGRDWLEANNLPRNPVYTPERACTEADPHPILEFKSPKNGDTITDSMIEIKGTADATGGFKGWALDFQHDGEADWVQLIESRQPVRDDLLAFLDLGAVPNGIITLRLRMLGPNDAYAETSIRLRVNLPLPPTPIPPTLTPSPTPVPPTDIPTDTPTPSPTPTPTEPPTEVPTETETPTPPA